MKLKKILAGTFVYIFFSFAICFCFSFGMLRPIEYVYGTLAIMGLFALIALFWYCVNLILPKQLNHENRINNLPD